MGYASYVDVRDFISGLVDLPYYLTCEIALYMTREQMIDGRPRGPMWAYSDTTFRPVL